MTRKETVVERCDQCGCDTVFSVNELKADGVVVAFCSVCAPAPQDGEEEVSCGLVRHVVGERVNKDRYEPRCPICGCHTLTKVTQATMLKALDSEFSLNEYFWYLGAGEVETLISGKCSKCQMLPVVKEE